MSFGLKDKAFFYCPLRSANEDKNQNELSLTEYAEHTEKDDRDIALIKRTRLSGQPSYT